MAGKNHHHVWQMLQRGFGTKRGKYHHIWMYDQSGEARQTSTNKFGSDDFFYGPEGSEADKNITAFENSAQELVHIARNAAPGYNLDSSDVAPLIAHLEMRSAFLRTEISNIGRVVFETLKDHFTSEKHVQDLLRAYLKNHPELLDDVLAEHKVPVDARQTTLTLVDLALPELIRRGGKEIVGLMNTELDPFIRSLSEVAKQAHIKSLRESFEQSPRVNLHSQLEYFTHEAEGDFILPDTTLAFALSSGCAPFTQKKDQIEQVILPVSSKSAIIGLRKGAALRTGASINRMLASCSYQNFIAKQQLDCFSQLAHRIGRNAELVSKSEMKRIVSFDDLMKL